jgi:HSP20 family protein
MATENESKKDIKKVESAHELSPFEEMDRLFESRFPRAWLLPSHWPRPSWGDLTAPFEGKRPRVDVIDRDNEVVVKAELPGVDKKDIDVSVTKNSVTIQGKTSHEEKEEKGDHYRCEISRGSYSRTLTLPAEVKEGESKAKIKDGILELTLPKVEKSKRHKVKVE